MKRYVQVIPVAACLIMLLTTGHDIKAAEPSTGKQPAAIVPFEILASNHMLIQAKINGKGPYQLIFDLGAPITLLNSRAAESSGAIGKDAPRSILFSVRGESTLRQLQLGELIALDVPVVVMDHPALKVLSRALERPIEGIVGYTFFARYKMTIDYQAKQIAFEVVKNEVRNLMEDLPTRLLGPKTSSRRVVAPTGLWGMRVDIPPPALSSRGVPVAEVFINSPAAIAGLKAGDILVSINGHWTTSLTDTYSAAASAGAGKLVPIELLREGKEIVIMIKPIAGF